MKRKIIALGIFSGLTMIIIVKTRPNTKLKERKKKKTIFTKKESDESLFI